MKKSILILFGKNLPPKRWLQRAKWYDMVISSAALQDGVQKVGLEWKSLENFVEPGSVHDAGVMAEKLSRLSLPDGSCLSKASVYKGYELWWTHLDDIFLYFCLPHTQYQKLLNYVRDFEIVYLYEPPFKNLFSCYLEAHERKMVTISKISFNFSLGIFFQILLTTLCLPLLMFRKYSRMVFIGDKLEKDRDHDFRMRFIYEELRKRKSSFVEFIRSPESWKAVLQHAWIRKRPVVYAEAVTFLGRLMSILSGGRRHAERTFGSNLFRGEMIPENRFYLLIATQYLLTIGDDIWSIRIMQWILQLTKVKVAIIIAASERNWHTVIGCKLNNIPTVGILHGINTYHYNMYDFLRGFDGENMLSVDRYGLWSEWWRDYYLKYSDAYKPEQLFVSGPMRPLETNVDEANQKSFTEDRTKVLFISEQVAEPQEVLPFFTEILANRDFEVTIKFRPSRDGFEMWLLKHQPELLKEVPIMRGSIQEAIASNDVVVGTHSTAVLESLFQFKVPIFFDTHKWGDYFNLKEYGVDQSFFASNYEELIKKIQLAKNVSPDEIIELRKRFFGDSYKNGSAWVVEQMEKYLTERGNQ